MRRFDSTRFSKRELKCFRINISPVISTIDINTYDPTKMEKNTLLVISFSLLEILQTLRFTSICYGSHCIKLSPLVFEAMLPSQKLVYIIDVTHHDLGQEHVFEGYVSQLI